MNDDFLEFDKFCFKNEETEILARHLENQRVRWIGFLARGVTEASVIDELKNYMLSPPNLPGEDNELLASIYKNALTKVSWFEVLVYLTMLDKGYRFNRGGDDGER